MSYIFPSLLFLASVLLSSSAMAQSPSPSASATPVSIELPPAPETTFQKLDPKCFSPTFAGALADYNAAKYEDVTSWLEKRRAVLSERKRFEREAPDDSLFLQALTELKLENEEGARERVNDSLNYRRARADALLLLAFLSPPTVARELLREGIFFGRGCLVPAEVLRYERARSLLINALPAQLTEADNELSEALKLNANYAHAIYGQGEIFLVKKLRDSAIAQFQKAASLPGAPALASLRAIDAILFQAHRQFNKEQLQTAYQSAQAELKKLEQGNPLEREVLVRLIRTAIEVGDLKAATSAHKRLSTLLPADDTIFKSLSDQLALEGKLQGSGEPNPSATP